jgi:16S rRNA (adenine1518-N6/adenine1519-N6)-dimethyltransferase
MVELAGLSGNESVVEIGTGKGVLTVKLATLCSQLEAYEVDPENYRQTQERLSGRGISVHLEDAFDRARSFDVLVSSLPYSRSAEFIDWISQATYSRAVVLLQEDFVRKITSPPGTRNYRAVSAIAQVASEVKVSDRVSRDAFRPRPKVNSLIVVME